VVRTASEPVDAAVAARARRHTLPSFAASACSLLVPSSPRSAEAGKESVLTVGKDYRRHRRSRHRTQTELPKSVPTSSPGTSKIRRCTAGQTRAFHQGRDSRIAVVVRFVDAEQTSSNGSGGTRFSWIILLFASTAAGGRGLLARWGRESAPVPPAEKSTSQATRRPPGRPTSGAWPLRWPRRQAAARQKRSLGRRQRNTREWATGELQPAPPALAFTRKHKVASRSGFEQSTSRPRIVSPTETRIALARGRRRASRSVLLSLALTQTTPQLFSALFRGRRHQLNAASRQRRRAPPRSRPKAVISR
jgi:hypothetical protein